MQIRSNPLKEPSPSSPITCFMYRPNTSDQNGTSNISHRKTEESSMAKKVISKEEQKCPTLNKSGPFAT